MFQSRAPIETLEPNYLKRLAHEEQLISQKSVISEKVNCISRGGKGVEGFTSQPDTTRASRNRNLLSSGATSNGGPGKPDNSGSGGDGGNGMPQYPKPESVQETKNRVDKIDEYMARMDDQSSDSETGQCEETNIEVKIVNDEIILRATRGKRSVLIDESTARKKIYHAPDFGVSLPDNLDLEYVKSLSPKDRLQYLSDPNILPQECVGEYMKKLGEHYIDPTTNIKADGTLGKNNKEWGEPIPGMHAFNPITGNDAFFADQGDQDSTFHTGMKLKKGQQKDLKDNNNIL